MQTGRNTRKRYRRNSKKNPWRNTREKSVAKKIQWPHLMAMVLVITVPLVCLCLCEGFLLKSADMYQYTFSANQSIENGSKTVESSDVVNLIEDYMHGNTKDFSLKENVDYEPENVFSKEDQVAAKNVRTWANFMMIIAGICLLLTALIYFLLIRLREFDTHRKYYKGACISYFILLAASSAIKLVPYTRKLIYGKIVGTSFPQNDYLVEILRDGFVGEITVFIALGSLIIFAIISYITWKLIGKRRVFK